MRTGLLALAAGALIVALAGCTSAGGDADAPTPRAGASGSVTPSGVSTPSTSPSAAASTAPPATPSPTPTSTPPAGPLAGLSLEQRVGQLFMVGSPATSATPATIDDVANLHIGGVFLSGRSTAGVQATAAAVRRFTAADRDGVPLLVSTDQEGGEVQVLRGPGFSDIPSALAQSRLATATLRADAAAWAGQLRAAGVDMDLGPVADVVASAQQAAANPPIGRLDREYGYGAPSALAKAGAFAGGMIRGGVVPVAKHFPGLGAVTGNTDFQAGVTDTSTTATSPSVSVYATLIRNGLPAVMVGTAEYTRIAPGVPAAFSPAVVAKLLRGQLGFTGVVMTDDVSAAKQVAAWTPEQRAVLAIQAGVDIVLVSASPQLAPQMIAAVVAKARAEPAFRAQVDAAATRVLALKQRYRAAP